MANAMEIIERNARMQHQLIEDLLDVSAIVLGKLRLDLHPVELAPVIAAAIDALRPAAEAKGIRLDVVVDPDIGRVLGDAARLQQIVSNLLSNAIKFTPAKGSAQVRVQRAASEAEITVADTGKGIAPEFLPHVFDRFSQAERSHARS